jgi:hypothetical protein
MTHIATIENRMAGRTVRADIVSLKRIEETFDGGLNSIRQDDSIEKQF